MATNVVTNVTPEKLSKFKKLTKNICDKIELDSAVEEFQSVCLPTDDHRRWENITKTLKDFSRSPKHDKFYKSVMTYNEGRKGSFETFDYYIENCLSEVTAFNELLGNIANLALKLPDLCRQPITILTKEDLRVTLNEEQICCLLCNAFFCTFPDTRRGKSHVNKHKRGNYNNSKYARQSSFNNLKMPTINFFGLFEKGKPWNEEIVAEVKSQKLDCIFHYFRTMLRRCEQNTCNDKRKVTFHRQVLINTPDWKNSEKSLSGVGIFRGGFIEDAQFLLQVDFANKLVGGGILGKGCVQEEIRFAICPELIVSRLITDELGDLECLIVTGIEQFSKYSGYSKSFHCEGEFEDTTPKDGHGRRMTQVLVIDALNFSYEKEQFDQQLILRELNKAYCGFECHGIKENERPAIATGNWGCGAFKGNKELKFLIQLLAASEAGRDICYFTFDDHTLVNRIRQMLDKLNNQKFTVGKLFRMVNETVESDSIRQKKEIRFFDCLGMAETTDSSEDEIEQQEDNSTTVSKDNDFLKGFES